MTPKITIIRRKFTVKPSIMLTVANTVGKIFEANMQDFTGYPHMSAEWLTALYADICRMTKATGVKGDEQQRAATAIIRAIEKDAINTTLTIKNQLERGYKNEKPRLNEMLSLLGYKTNWQKAMNNNHSALLELLQTFSNHTSDLLDELTEHNVAAVHIEKVKEFAQMMNEANITQEVLKAESPVITSEINSELNCIYDRVMDICSAGKIIYRKDPVKRAMFSFQKLAATQQTPSSKGKPDENGETGGNTGETGGNTTTPPAE